MENSIQYYIPERISTLLAENKNRLLRSEKLSGGVLFFDLVKFTRLTAMLSESGPRGAEKLHELMTTYYDLMIGIIHRYGGTIYQFAGDSALAAFEKKDSDDQSIMLCLSACALEMRDTLKASHLHYKDHKFETKFALSYGDFRQILLGDEHSYFQIVLTGTTVDSVVQAEISAHANEVILSPTMAAALKPYAEIEESGGLAKLKKLNQTVEVKPRPLINPGNNKPQFIKKCARFIPPVVVERIKASRLGYLGEFRDVTSIFIQAKGIEISSGSGFVDRLNTLYKLILELCHTFGGTLTQCDFSDKGSVFLVLFGAPVAVEKKESTAVRFALKLMESVKQLNFISNLHVGMATGPLYCGDVGSEKRKGYSVLGTSINFASRLMEYSDGQYPVTDQKTAKSLENAFILKEQSGVPLKGISGNFQVFTIEGEKKESKSQVNPSSLLGRKKELSWLTDRLAETTFNGITAGVIGEAGVGKSRLIYEFIKTAKSDGFEVFNGICYSYEKFTPYFPWKSILAKLFNIQEELTAEFALDKIEEILSTLDTSESDNAIKAWAHLFYRIMGGSVEESEYTQNIDSKKKNEHIFEFIAQKLRLEIKNHKVLLSFEDFHWADEGSENLIRHLLQEDIPGLLVLFASRPEGTFENLKSFENYKEFRLEEFSPEDAKEYLRAKMNLAEIDRESENLENDILNKARGNPFFLESIVFSLREEGILTINSDRKFTLKRKNNEIQIPDSLQGVLLARIDRLGETEKVVLKNASVIGRLFAYNLLLQISPKEMEAQLHSYLDTLELNDFTMLETTNPLSYIFKHVLIRDAAYHSLLSTTKENLHNRLAMYLEGMGEQQLRENLEQIAFHFYSAKNTEKAIHYSLMAAHNATASYAIADAIHHYGNILQLLDGSHGKSELLYDVKIELGHVYRLGGHFQEAIDTFQEPLSMVKDKNRLARIHMGIGQAYQEQGLTGDATKELEISLNLLGEKIPKNRFTATFSIAKELIRQMIYNVFPVSPFKVSGSKIKTLEMEFDILDFLAKIYFFIDVEKYSWAVLKQVNIAGKMNIDRYKGRTYASLALIYGALGFYKLADKNIAKSEHFTAKSNDPLSEAISLQRAGSVEMYRNNPKVWLEKLTKARALNEKFGETWEKVLTMGTITVSLFYMGKYKETCEHNKKVMELALSENARQFQGWALSTEGCFDYILTTEPVEKYLNILNRAADVSLAANDLASYMATLRFIVLELVNEKRGAEALEKAYELQKGLSSYSSIIPHAHIGYYDIIEAAELAIKQDLLTAKEAEKLWKPALKRIKRLGKKYYFITAYSLCAQAKAYTLSGNLKAAQSKITEGIAWLENTQNQWEKVITYFNAAQLIPERKKEFIEKGMALCHEYGYTRNLVLFEELLKQDHIKS